MNASQLRTFAADPAGFIAQLKIDTANGPQSWGAVAAEFQRERMAALAPALVALSRGEKPNIGHYWMEGTKGTSKDSDMALAMLWLLLFARRPLLCQVGAADADQADELRKAAESILFLNPWLAAYITIQNWRIIGEITSATVEIVAADTAGSHGARPDVLVINELSHITRREAAENWRDNAAKVGNGLVVIATNAGFENSWQFDWREIARTSDRWFFHQWAQPSPWIDPAEVAESERRNSRARHLRLFWGVWARGAGDALDPDTIDGRIVLTNPANVCPPDYVAIAGLDLGVKRDHSAFIVLGAGARSQRVALLDCKSWAPIGGQVNLIEVRESILRAQDAFALREVWYDPSQAQLMAQELRAEGVAMKEMSFVGANLNAMASSLLEAFRSARIDLYDDPRLIDDLKRLNIVERAFGMKLEAPADTTRGHCDRALALAIALPAALKAASNANTGDSVWDPSLASTGALIGPHHRGFGPFSFRRGINSNRFF